MKYYTLIQGGEGPDVWDKEFELSAVDFKDASNQALAKAEEHGGHVSTVDVYTLAHRHEDDEIKALVDRFLAWPLPETVSCDACVLESGRPLRVGTNLLTATEAKQMFEYLLKHPAP